MMFFILKLVVTLNWILQQGLKSPGVVEAREGPSPTKNIFDYCFFIVNDSSKKLKKC